MTRTVADAAGREQRWDPPMKRFGRYALRAMTGSRKTRQTKLFAASSSGPCEDLPGARPAEREELLALRAAVLPVPAALLPMRAALLPMRDALLQWFARAARPLPWRANRDPYRVWISEAMLQQTRVETVIPYFERFLARFPTLGALAEAPEDDVLAQWSGLGYYRRARTLHAAAQTIVREHGGRFPRTREALLALPGIGPYTAGAVASIAFDQPEPLVDGNVARVLSRLFAIDGAPESRSFRDATWTRAAELVKAGDRAGAWNQALMELGATVCRPREPRCDVCPISTFCRALSEDRVGELPRPKSRKQAVDVELLVLAIVERGRLLLERRPTSGRMSSMWQLPTIETSGGELIAPARWPLDERGHPALAELEPLGEVRHTITHHRIRARVFRGRLLAGEPPPSLAWFARAAIEDLARTGMTKKILRAGFLAASSPGAVLQRTSADGM
jgi:A/G-specific adenine glycosylase